MTVDVFVAMLVEMFSTKQLHYLIRKLMIATMVKMVEEQKQQGRRNAQ